jgi:hypothetical protein
MVRGAKGYKRHQRSDIFKLFLARTYSISLRVQDLQDEIATTLAQKWPDQVLKLRREPSEIVCGIEGIRSAARIFLTGSSNSQYQSRRDGARGKLLSG